MYVEMNRATGTFVDLYYKSGNTAGTFDTNAWVLAPPTNAAGVAFSDGTSFDETIYTIAPTVEFTIFALKIVMRSTGTSNIPKIQDLRAIALKV